MEHLGGIFLRSKLPPVTFVSDTRVPSNPVDSVTWLKQLGHPDIEENTEAFHLTSRDWKMSSRDRISGLVHPKSMVVSGSPKRW